MERLTHKARYEAGYKANRNVHDWECVDKLGKLEDLEEQGMLLKLPCAVGDTIYIVLHNHKIDERKVVGFKMIAKGWAAEVSDWCYLFEEFGKTVFLTPESAEAALRNIGKDEYGR